MDLEVQEAIEAPPVEQASSAAALTASDITAICSAVIALAALIVAVWQGWIARKHARLSARPVLSLRLDFAEGGPFILSLVNKGTGPAIIDEISLADRSGSKWPCSMSGWLEAVESLGLKKYSPSCYSISPGDAVAANTEFCLVKITGAEKIADAHAEMAMAMLNLLVPVRYSSVYEEQFEVSQVSDELL